MPGDDTWPPCRRDPWAPADAHNQSEASLGTSEESSDLVLRKARHGPGMTTGDQRDASGRRWDATEGRAVDAGRAARARHYVSVPGAHGHEERTGRDRAHGVQAEGLAELAPFRQHRHALTIHAKSHAGGLGHFPAGGGEPAFRRIVHGMHTCGATRGTRLGHHADARRAEKAPRALHHVRGDTAPDGLVSALTGN